MGIGKDWTGNKKSAWAILAAPSHADKEREVRDYYATEPKATELLMDLVEFSHDVWEPACGEGHMAEVLKKHDYHVLSTDIFDYGYGDGLLDFLHNELEDNSIEMDIITNPPYKYAAEFVEKAMNLITDGHKVAMFLKIQFLESQQRKELFKKFPPFGCICVE